MSTQFSSFVLLYEGQLSISQNFVPTYIGGRNKPMEVPRNTKLNGLKSRVLQALNLDGNKFTVELVGRIPVGEGFIATNIDDEEVCRIVLRQAIKQFIIIYVEIQPITSVPLTQTQDRPSSSQFVATEYIPYEESLMCTPQDYPNVISYPQVNTLESVPNQHLETTSHDAKADTIYETMSSGSSDESNDDYDMSYLNEGLGASNNDVEDIIRSYCQRNSNSVEDMTNTNDFVETCYTTEEWDADISNDTSDVNMTIENPFTIPTDLHDGMCFSTKGFLKFAVQGWSITNNVQYKVIASNNKVYTTSCVNEDAESRPCTWRLHALSSKRLGGVWKISTLSLNHTCINPTLKSGHRQCNSDFISFFILPTIRQQMDLKPKEIIARMESKFNVRVSYIKAWDARRKALKKVFGSWEESYRSIYLFMDAITVAMPGSVYRIQVSQSKRFKRIFWAFKPCIDGWMKCRPVLSLDGTFLLGKYRGTLLIAVGIDGNNGLFPLSFAIVESECNDSWLWFLQCLKELIPETCSREDLCFISDRHKGLVNGCREVFPAAAHRSCLRHLRENFKKAIRKMGISDIEFMCNKMYQAGNTSDINIFNNNMHDIKTIKEEAYQWLIDHELKRWTLIHDEGCRYGSMTTNASESFNGVLKRARGLPIQALIMAIYYNIVGIFIKRRQQLSQSEPNMNNLFCRATSQAINSLENEARQLPVPVRINQTEFQVYDMSGFSYRVDVLEDGQCRCQCGRPEMCHLPCPHVISCLALVRRSHYDYVSPYFTLCYQKEIYSGDFHCIPDRSYWREYDTSIGFFPLLPPDYIRSTGRPRVARIRNTMDERTSTTRRTCSNCKIVGHNRSTCSRRHSNV